MRVSVVGSYPKVVGFEVMGHGDLGGTNLANTDDGKGEGLEGGSRDWVVIRGGVGDFWVEGISRVTSGLSDGTGGGT